MSLPRTGGLGGRNDASRRAIAAACVGNAAEWYDFAIYGALATVIGVVYFPAGNPAAALSAAFAAYGTALLVRPLGALVFGRMGDRRGRRSVLILVIFLMAGATAVVAFLPGYASDRPTRSPRSPAAPRGAGTGRRRRARRGRRLHPGARPESRTGDGRRLAHGDDGGRDRLRYGGGGRAQLLVRGRGPDSGWWRIAFLIAIPLGAASALLLRRRITDTEQFLTLRAGLRLSRSIRFGSSGVITGSP